MRKIYQYILSLVLIIPIIARSQSLSVAVTAGKSIYKTKDNVVILETANDKKPTLGQGPIALIADTMIYDENDKVGHAYGGLRFADLDNRTYFSAQEGSFYTQENKIVLRKAPEILLEQNEDVTTKVTGEVITIYPDDSYIHVEGQAVVNDGEVFVTGDEVRIWSKEERVIVSGNVQVLADPQRLKADRISIQFRNGGIDYYIARDNVVAVNPEDNFTLQAELLTYEGEKDLYKATSNSYIYFQDQETISYANIIEYNRETQMGDLIGDVISIQGGGEQKAYSRWAKYDGSNNIINMYGNPRLVQKDSEIFGQQVIVYIDSNMMNIIGGGRGFFNKNQ